MGLISTAILPKRHYYLALFILALSFFALTLSTLAVADSPRTVPLSATTGSMPAQTPSANRQALRLSVLQQLDPTLATVVRRTYMLPKNTPEPEASYVASTMSFPWRYVGYLEIVQGANQIGTCTGTLISRHVVLTAAHCVYGENGLMRDVTFFPALNGKKSPFGRFKARDIVLLDKIQGELDNNYDVAFIILDQSPYTRDQYRQHGVPMGVVDDRHFEQSKDDYPLGLVAAGYPTLDSDDPAAGKLVVRATTRYRNSIIAGKNNQFEHQAITKEGTSGGPIFAIDPLYNQFALIGLISAQRTWSTGDVWAVGIKINPFSLKRIRNVVARYEPDYRAAPGQGALRASIR